MPHGSSPRHERKSHAKKTARAGDATSTTDEAASTTASGDAPSAPAEETPSASPAESAVPPIDSRQRLQKLLAAAGFGSRRQVESFLVDERVTVNGRVATLGDKADPQVDEIRVDGERLARERPAYWIVHKPRGVITTVRDTDGRKTVMDLLPRTVGRLFPVGRLDLETSGLLLMTNDGDLAHALLHPSLGNEREYRVNVRGELDAKAIDRLERGVSLEEGRTAAARVSDVRYDPDSKTTSLSLTLIEGKKRQIRRSLLVLGFPVRRLVRVRMGPLKIGRLPVGEARALRSEEKRALLEHVRRLKAGEPVTAAARKSGAGTDLAAPPKKSGARRGRGVPRKSPSKPSGAEPPSGPRARGGRRPTTGRGTASEGRPPQGPRGGGGGRPSSGPRGASGGRAPSGPRGASGGRAPSGPRGASGGRAPSRPRGASGGRAPSGPRGASGGRAPSRPRGAGDGRAPAGPRGSTGGRKPAGPRERSDRRPPAAPHSSSGGHGPSDRAGSTERRGRYGREDTSDRGTREKGARKPGAPAKRAGKTGARKKSPSGPDRRPAKKSARKKSAACRPSGPRGRKGR